MTDQLVDPLTVAADLIDAEIERMRQRWLDHCRGRRRRPPLTRAQKKRAVAIAFDDSPRETLVSAWAGATDRDRRDLLKRATGKVI